MCGTQFCEAQRKKNDVIREVRTQVRLKYRSEGKDLGEVDRNSIGTNTESSVLATLCIVCTLKQVSVSEFKCICDTNHRVVLSSPIQLLF